MSWVSDLFGGGLVKSIEGIAKEWIDTPGEKAEAEALMIKTLDPNGLMRRDMARRVAFLYTVYIFIALGLGLATAFGLGTDISVGDKTVKSTVVALEFVKELFVPITTMFSIIIGAIFGVSYANVKAGK